MFVEPLTNGVVLLLFLGGEFSIVPQAPDSVKDSKFLFGVFVDL